MAFHRVRDGIVNEIGQKEAIVADITNMSVLQEESGIYSFYNSLALRQ
jgi:hypothetical protein